MRRLAVAAIAPILLWGCASPAPAPEAGAADKTSYNRRELEPRPGLFTGRDGVWTIYRNDQAPAPAEAPPPRPRTILLEEKDSASGPR
jgi:hypothetical protein